MVSVSAETLPSACISLFCCVRDVSEHQPLGSGMKPPANNSAQGVRPGSFWGTLPDFLSIHFLSLFSTFKTPHAWYPLTWLGHFASLTNYKASRNQECKKNDTGAYKTVQILVIIAQNIIIKQCLVYKKCCLTIYTHKYSRKMWQIKLYYSPFTCKVTLSQLVLVHLTT